jgi:hypothetical protein
MKNPIKCFSGSRGGFTKKPLAAGGIFLLMFIAFQPLFCADAKPVSMRLPFHVQGYESEISKDALTLFINGIEKPIQRIDRRTRRLKRANDLSRYFILSFQQENEEPALMEAVQYFIQNIATPTDSLTLVSPVGVYRLDLSGGGDGALDRVEEILKRDLMAYKNSRFVLMRKVKHQIAQINRMRTRLALFVRFYTFVLEFYNQCLDAIPDFKNHFLTPYLKQDKVIKELPPHGDGDIWWIHFKRRSFDPIPDELRQAIHSIAHNQRAQTTRAVRGYKAFDFSLLEKKMEIERDFPSANIAQAMASENVCYNVIYWGADGGAGAATNRKLTTTEVSAILKQITQLSGGRFIESLDPIEALKELQTHEDTYYEATYPFNGTIEAKSVNLILSSKISKGAITYARHIPREKVHNHVKELQAGKVEIQGFNLHGNHVKFKISQFQRHGKEKIGLLKVRIQLFTGQAEPKIVFNTLKTLRAARDEVDISLPLPKLVHQPHIIRLTVCDLNSNRLAQLQKIIGIRP